MLQSSPKINVFSNLLLTLACPSEVLPSFSMSHGDYAQSSSSDGALESTDGDGEGEGDVEQLFPMEASGEFAHPLDDGRFSGGKHDVQKSQSFLKEGARQPEAICLVEGTLQPP